MNRSDMAHVYTREKTYTHHSAITGVIFDNDNTLFVEPANAQEYHTKAGIEALRTQLPLLSEIEMRQLMEISKKTGGSFDIFEREFSIDMQQLRRDHYRQLIRLTSDGKFFDPTKTPVTGLTKLKNAGIELYVATHGNDQWTEHTALQTGVSQFFKHGIRVCKDHVPGHLGKNESVAMYQHLLDRLNIPRTGDPQMRGANYAMVEDTLENLNFAKQLGMLTILIDTGKYDKEKLPNYVDVIINNRDDSAAVVLESNENYDYDIIPRHYSENDQSGYPAFEL